ncbi:MAG TPA: dicarboxylate/amino acid:cation symporter [Candidatus Atopostipes pullistercoris]|uniref:Dicarboxylate/amino acid:cation symporter n=1 Tax=Candidatus Atopostipes pullistercoris TaxID=2838467 RepID=A0A9D2G2J5_9LACT|nr:dicarboxylate/amino acid:cation symporter [Candidatus Atopostipes pullistercoris]
MKKKLNLGLVPKIILAIIMGIVLGQLPFVSASFIRLLLTFAEFFSSFLNFVIPLMIVGLITKGIAELTEGAGKLLGVTFLTAYGSTLVSGTIAYFVAIALFPKFITPDLVESITATEKSLTPYFSIPLEPLLSVTSALVFAFMMGVGISWLKTQKSGEVMYEFFVEFEAIIMKVLSAVIVPILPFYIMTNFANMSYSGSVFNILSIFWRVFMIVIVLQILYISLMFILAGLYTGKNPFTLIKNQIPGYLTALGTQSSAATIPINVKVAKKNGVSEIVRNFVVPLGATIHLAGSMITIVTTSVAVLLISGLPTDFLTVGSFIAVLGLAMIAAPGAPGGAIMSALPFLPIIGIVTDTMQQLMISLYITQDSFGTAANVSGDNAIAVFIDKWYHHKNNNI